MTITDKIITFSYGTFSCSLQGFDDKFDILKPIAEYFRDLWLSDPQSNAGRPAPDADDLARIVGDVISHPVQGYMAQGVIILSPAPAGELPDAAAEADTGLDHEDNENIEDISETGEISEELASPSRHLSEATEADSPAHHSADDAGAEIEDSQETEPSEDENIFDAKVAGGDAARVDDLAKEDDSSEDDPGEDENIFEDAQDGGDETTDSDAVDSEIAEQTAKPVVIPSRIARVIKMKREDFEAAINGGVIEEDIAAPDDAAGGAPGQGLSPESEADLQRKLAEAGGDQKAEAKPVKPKAPARRRGVDRLQSSERRSDLERIFDEADSQMGKSDSSERRNAIQHLRAAVAATRAEKSAGHELNKNIDETPYRTDLAEAVDVPTGVDKKARAKRKNTSILPPLKLVTDQRIDPDES